MNCQYSEDSQKYPTKDYRLRRLTAMGKYTILIVEDDAGLNQGILLALRQDDICFFQAYTVEEAKKIWKAMRSPDFHLARTTILQNRSA